MTRRPYLSRFECGEPGCPEVASYEAATRRDQASQYQRYGQGRWRCVRHSQAHEMLGPAALTKTHEIKSERRFTDSGHDIGLYWGHFGFVSGPGFKAFAKDFPEGTILRVTAEIILPDPQPTPAEPERIGASA